MRVNGAPRPAFDSGEWIARAERAYRTPVRTSADHEDDELMHGRVGASYRAENKDPAATFLWLVLMVMAGVLAVAAGLIGVWW